MSGDSHKTIREAAEGASFDVSESIRIRREEILELAKCAEIPVFRFPEYDRIGPVRVTHDWQVTEVYCGRLRLEEIEGDDVGAAAARVVGRVRSIMEDRFDSLEFFEGFWRAYRQAAQWYPHSHSDPASVRVRIDHVYSQFAVARIMSKIRNEENRRTRVTGTEHYGLPDFLIDLAKYLKNPESPDDCFLSVSAPSEEELDRGFLIPDLSDVSAGERPILHVSIIPDGPL